ncbi:hypothetical protein OV208_23185 [Corallococcus sp. bb12-1]|uniref:hypothetical protein n=1 Tax=Corallococcus sp. bb12-1 TaxID=2996784 RepID=UPI002270C120|nr:hypothetical protein [Corallococcus sp. bb12-1]MCY1044242.1 hypothetical protein [Corallococcus sp. bb12-1]
MMNWHKARLAGLVATVLMAACSGCGDEDGETPDDEDPTEQTDRPGFANSDKEPEGLPFNLPAGIELTDPIKGFNPFDPDGSCKREEDEKALAPRGSGDLIRLCMEFRNTTNGPINIELPPGLIFVSSSQKVQHGMLVQGLTIEVPSDQYMVAPIKGYCLNDTRSGNAPTDLFKKGPVTQYSDFKELFALLASKQLPVTGGAVAQIQSIVWNLTHEKALTQAERDFIAALPNK